MPQTGGSPAMLKVDRESVPRLRQVFDRALAELDVQIDLAISGVRVSPWAGDPVSGQAAHDFNQHTVDGRDSALAALYAYQRRLKSAADALTRVAHRYDIVEADTTSTFGG